MVYWGQSACSPVPYSEGDLAHRKWVACDGPDTDDKCRKPNTADGLFRLASPWTNETNHFNVTPDNTLNAAPGFVSADPTADLNFALQPSSPSKYARRRFVFVRTVIAVSKFN